MKKPFLLIAGDNYYPGGGTSDWVGCYATKEEALAQIGKPEGHEGYCGLGGHFIKARNYSCDWFEIIDLREWQEDSEYE